MIIETLLNVIHTVLDTLLFFEIPSLPATVGEYLNTFFEYLTLGASILANYTPFSYLMTLFVIIVGIETSVHVYELVLWILRKIPMIGIS